ncbi:MAG: PAS domain-containing sensor histidine kinase [Bdellovibrionales bacterium]|nr:PAS domain-containing sensor histidine kinase [Oligoflexia bacterium]
MSSNRLQTLFASQILDSPVEGFAMVDLLGRISFVNETWCQLLGYSREELLGTFFADLLPSETRKSLLKKIFENLEVGVPRVETTFRKKNGEWLWIIATSKESSAETDYGPGTLIFISDFSETKRLREEALCFAQSLEKVVHDKTHSLMNAHSALEKEAFERQKLEDQLLRVQGEFRSFFETCPLYLGIVDLTSDGIRHVIDSPSVHRFFELGSKSTDGKLAKDLNVSLENLGQWKIRCEQSRLEKKPVQWEFSTTRGSGSLRTFSVYTSFIGMTAEGCQRFSYTAEEITEKRELERKREEQTSRISQLSKMSALGEMASGIAHEIYNPLTIIKGFADLLAKRSAQGQVDPGELISITKEIQSTCKRVTEIIEGLRFFAREGSQDPLEFTSVENLVVATIRICAERFKKYGVKLEVFHYDNELTIACRDVQISQVILNLLNNAFDAVRNESVKIIRIETEGHADHALIRVQDSGPGISVELQARIFEPFFTTKPIGLGTGMGLSICKGIMESHFGSINLIPSSQGACFQLRLPQDQSAEERSERGH